MKTNLKRTERGLQLWSLKTCQHSNRFSSSAIFEFAAFLSLLIVMAVAFVNKSASKFHQLIVVYRPGVRGLFLARLDLIDSFCSPLVLQDTPMEPYGFFVCSIIYSMVLLCALKRSRTALFSVWPVILASYFWLQATASSSTRLFASHRAHNQRNGGNASIGAEDEQ